MDTVEISWATPKLFYNYFISIRNTLYQSWFLGIFPSLFYHYDILNKDEYDFNNEYDFSVRLNSSQEFAKSLSGQVSWPSSCLLRELLKIYEYNF